jgi:hypothetical protein
MRLVAGFPPWRPRFEPGSGHFRFVVDKVALGQVSSEYFGFPCQSSFHQMLHNHPHLSSGASTIGQKWPQYLMDLVPPHLKKNHTQLQYHSHPKQMCHCTVRCPYLCSTSTNCWLWTPLIADSWIWTTRSIKRWKYGPYMAHRLHFVPCTPKPYLDIDAGTPKQKTKLSWECWQRGGPCIYKYIEFNPTLAASRLYWEIMTHLGDCTPHNS